MSDLYTEIVNTTRALIIVFDAEGRIVMFNPACERLTGYRFEEVQGLLIWDFLLLPEEIDGVKAVFADLRAGHFPNTHDNHWLTKSGERRFIEWSNSAVTDKSGRVAHVMGTGIDVTEKCEAERAMREGNERFRHLAENIPLVFWVREVPDNRISYVSPAYEQVWGRKLGDFDEAYQSFAQSIHPDDREALFQKIQKETGGSARTDSEYRIVRPDGTIRWIHSSAIPFPDESGQVRRIFGVAEDITERRLAEAQRMARDAGLRAALVQEVHHRIKNNLQGVITFIQQLASRHPENASLVDAVIARLNAIASVHGLYGTLGENDHRLEQILLTLVSSLKVINADLPVRLSIRSSPESVRVTAGEIVPLALVVNELIMNATKHSRSTVGGDPVEIVLETAGNCASITISTHSGQLPGQFDFATGAGLGTGLALVKSLLPPAGAELRFENLAAPGGTKVELTLRPPVINSLLWQAS